ncbi:hypothetical protein [Bradyrhizobium sp.]|uniref:hypothetical protein n=1 Tax=Bradyrhizobium sp. TaxID=376 RepID=UPI000B2EC49E|nr:hypothetical protein [Bradyrhizobium sp.]
MPALRLPTELEAASFVDPWIHDPKHRGPVPVDAVFVGQWDDYVGIDDITEVLFLVPDDRRDLLWSLTTYGKDELDCGCVAGAPRAGTQKDAAIRLVKALVRARYPKPPIFTWPPRDQ